MISKCFIYSSIILFVSFIYGEPINNLERENLQNENEFDLISKLVDFYSMQSMDVISDLCKNHTKQYKEDLKKMKPWALKMLDSSSKFQSGLLFGNLIDLGHYEQCIGIKESSNYGPKEIKGKHCLLSIVPDNNTIFDISPSIDIPIWRITDLSIRSEFGSTWSVCVPNSCMAKDIQAHFQQSIPELLNGLNLNVTVIENSCHTDEEFSKYRSTDKVVIFLLVFLLLIIVISTALDTYMNLINANDEFPRILTAFSVYTNTKRLLKVSDRGEQMGVLHGIRFMSTLWVVIFHRFFVEMFNAHLNTLDLQNWLNTLQSSIIQGSTVMVDTFFLMSGLLVAVSFFRSMEKDGSINLFKYYIHRYLRLTPTYMLVALIYATLLVYFGSGPLWKDSALSLQNSCRTYWWSTMLYIQNYVNPTSFCVVQTWYLSVDMQLFWLSPLILYPLWKWPTYGLIQLFILIPIPMGVSYYLAWKNHYKGVVVFSKTFLQLPNFADFYVTTHCRASPWLIGVLLGYVIYKTKNKKIIINRGLVGLLWTSSCLILLIVVFCIHPLQQFDKPLMLKRNSAFHAFSRSAWTAALSWFIFACIHGYGGILNTFLSSKIFQVLGRLGYSVFLVHLGLQFLMGAALKTPTEFSVFNSVYQTFGDVGLSLALSICLTIGFEIPVNIIEDYVFKKFAPKMKNKANGLV